MNQAFLKLAATLAFTAAASFAEQFTIFVYESKADFAARTDPAKAAAYWKSYSDFGAQLAKAGILRGGAALQPRAAAKTITAGKPRQNGAYARAAQDLGGFFLIEVESMDKALEWAAKVPASQSGAVEVRPAIPNPDMK